MEFVIFQEIWSSKFHESLTVKIMDRFLNRGGFLQSCTSTYLHGVVQEPDKCWIKKHHGMRKESHVSSSCNGMQGNLLSFALSWTALRFLTQKGRGSKRRTVGGLVDGAVFRGRGLLLRNPLVWQWCRLSPETRESRRRARGTLVLFLFSCEQMESNTAGVPMVEGCSP